MAERNDKKFTVYGLLNAVSVGQLDDVKEHIRNDVNVSGRAGPFINTSLHVAVDMNHLEVMQFLLSSGANVNKRNINDDTPLHLAVQHGNVQAVELLLCTEADINARNKSGITPLHRAAEKGDIQLVELLVSRGADVDSTDNWGNTPLHKGTENGHAQVVEFLLSKVANVDSKDNIWSNTSLHRAAWSGLIQMVDLFVTKGSCLSSRNDDGDTPLHIASWRGKHQVVELLLSRGVDIDSRNKHGNTPLHHTMKRGHFLVMESLVLKGADPDIKNNCGKTPTDLAIQNGHLFMPRRMERILQRKKKKIMTSLRKYLDKAKREHGKVQVRFVRIMFTGSGAAGKTSFRNLLLKKEINKLHDSTNVVEVSQAVSVRKAVVIESTPTANQGVLWLEMDQHSDMNYMRQILSSKHSNFEQERQLPSGKQKTEKSGIAQQNNNSRSTLRSENFVVRNPPISAAQSLGRRFTDVLSGSPKIKSKKLGSFESLVDSSLQASSSFQADSEAIHQPGKVLNIITLLDTGGQPEYIHLLPTINANPVVTFVVHDLSKSLEDQVLVEYSEHGEHVFEPYHLRYSNFDVIKFLMSSINDSLERPACQVPQLVTIPGKNTNSYLCCVGTHADNVTSEIICKTDKKLTAMVEKIDCKAAVWSNENGGVLFPVDNTTAGDTSKEDPVANLIRNKIETLAFDKDIYDVPITWMLFELEIRQVCASSGKTYISIQECYSIAMESNLLQSEQVKSALSYYHLLGVLLYYPDVPGLCEYVIVDHQWLFDKLSNLVCVSFRDSSSNLLATKKLKYSGIFSKELLQELRIEEELKEEYFISLLVEMKIIAPIHREDGSGEDYFIPYVLPTYTSQSQGDDILSQYGYLQGEPLLIQFVSNLLPRGFFCCLVVQLLQHLPKGWNHVLAQQDIYHTYSNLTSFSLPHGYLLSLLDKLFYLEIQIRHERELYYHHVSIHLAVQDVLADALQGVCEQLSYNQGRLQYGFHCQCEGFNEEHIAVLTTMIPPFDYARCGHGSLKLMNLNSTHVVWLTENHKYCEAVKDIEIQETKQKHEGPQTGEYKLFTEYYSKLVDTLPASDLSHYFVSHRAISLADHEEITKPTTASYIAVEILLSRVSSPLQKEDDIEPLNKMLAIMEHHGNSATKALSLEMRTRMFTEAAERSRQGSLLQHSVNQESAFLTELNDKLECPSLEYTVLIDYYSKLVDSLSAKKLTHHFVSRKIISPKDEEEILRPSTSTIRGNTLILSKVVNPLKAGFKNCSDGFYEFLNILEDYGSVDNKSLSLAIRNQLYTNGKAHSITEGSKDDQCLSDELDAMPV
ncbi:uncharacterized protein [Dysidea avara]|uniref:uncharacterized protein isoform X2 n=1 Tax=Dysidea avara TaxID=196820 RepID=UPI003318329C